jgi:hypothetical protein
MKVSPIEVTLINNMGSDLSIVNAARVCNLRLDSHTQKETQLVAQQISNHMKELFPESWKVLVAE